MNKITLFSVAVVFIVCFLLCAACPGSETAEKGPFWVTFDKNGGDTEANPQSISVTPPAKTIEELPAPPTRSGYNFAGWRTPDNKVFNASTIVESDITVKARWQQEVVVDPRNNFHVYLCFGQSNMVGYVKSGSAIPNEDKNVSEGFKVMAAANNANNPSGRQMGQWYTAVPPLVRSGTGLSPASYFGSTLLEEISKADPDVTVGVIVVAVDGAAINGFSKNETEAKAYYAAQQSWMQNQSSAYNNYPYGRLVEMAKKAQETGVIKGIIMHQGESGKATYNNGAIGSNGSDNANWGKAVREIYDNLLKDLELEPASIPFLAGQQVGNNSAHIGAVASSFPDDVAYVISSDGCSAWNASSSDQNDRIHFSFEGYRELGRRYAQKMFELLY